MKKIEKNLLLVSAIDEYSGDLNTKLVWYSNGGKEVRCQMVWYLNTGQPDYLNTGQMDAILFLGIQIVGLVHSVIRSSNVNRSQWIILLCMNSVLVNARRSE